ncbi:MAG TPA: DUF3307 domain-containing protein [Candidatus Acidoferrum sp.]|nr:DUF3307 domain-containing protein [Candidatus Acidoferrum sp.]
MHSLLTAFLGLYLSHLLTDFVLQSDRMVAGKRRRSILAYAEHGAIHFLSAALFVGFAIPGLALRWSFYVSLLALALVHLAIDSLKLRLVRSETLSDGAATFLTDQALHALTVFLTAWLLIRPPFWTLLEKFHWAQSAIEKPLVVSVVYVGVIFGGGYVVRFLTRPLTKQDMSIFGETSNEMQNAGMYIGWLERFVVLTALVLQSPATVGLILTAKSIARYPEMKSVRFAEYFLIGTLLSMSLGIIGGLILLKLFYGAITLSK